MQEVSSKRRIGVRGKTTSWSESSAGEASLDAALVVLRGVATAKGPLALLLVAEEIDFKAHA